jgi:hypothetical protein
MSLVRLDLLLPRFSSHCRGDTRHAQECADRSDRVESAGYRAHEGGYGQVLYFWTPESIS